LPEDFLEFVYAKDIYRLGIMDTEFGVVWLFPSNYVLIQFLSQPSAFIKLRLF